MTMEDAKKIVDDSAIVLVSISDLEKGIVITNFKRSRFNECYRILEDGKTIAKLSNELVNSLNIYSEKQDDPIHYKPIGRLSTVLFL